MIAVRTLKKDGEKRINESLGKTGGPYSLRTIVAMLWSFTLFGLLNPSIVRRAAAESLAFCAVKLIPSLFPLAAAGSILSIAGGRSLGAGEGRCGRWLRRVSGWMGLSPSSVVCLLMGLFAGFPVGAIIASSLAENGQIDSEEASRLCCFTNNASAAFLVSAVGSGMFGDARIGWLLWIGQTLAALTVGIFMGRRAVKRSSHASVKSERTLGQAPIGWGSVSRAIASSAEGMISLTAFVVFFASFTAFAESGMNLLFARLDMGNGGALIGTAVGGFFELSSGIGRASALNLPTFAKTLLSAAMIGWSGLSVYMQVLAAAKGLKGEYAAALPRRLVKAKAVSALLTAVYTALLYRVMI